ncbi:MAG: DUF4258 domain-containing protein [Candidatus Omnitrophota bacterium]
MISLFDIRNQLASGRFEFSRHAFKRAIERNISDLEIMEAGENAIIIEEYPEDKYSPSLLLLGFTQRNRPLHLQVTSTDETLVKIITFYEPDENHWDNSLRRK